MISKIIHPIIYAVIAILLTIDFFRVSVGASSFVAFTHLEVTAGFEILLTCILLVMAYLKLRAAQVKSMLIIIFFVVWFAMFGINIEFADKLLKENNQHWDNQILRLVEDGHSDSINQVDWSKNVPGVRKQCAIVDKKIIHVFPDRFEYQVQCSQPKILLITRITIHTNEGNASAYVSLEP